MKISKIKSKALFLLFAVISIAPIIAEASDLTEPPRIICWGRGNTLVLNMLYMFPEAPDTLIAMGSTSQAGGSFQQLVDPEFKTKAVLDMEIQPETAASYKPTAIVLKSYMRSAAESLNKLGIPLIFINMESPEQYDDELQLLGNLFGNPLRAEDLRAYFREERIEAQTLVSRSEIPKSRVLFLYYSRKGGSTLLKVPPADWIQTRMVQWAGGEPVWTEGLTSESWQTVSFEQIAAWKPEKILLVTYHDDSAAVTASLQKDPVWKLLESEILAFPGDFLSWDQPDPRWILGLNWLGYRLHPDVFPAGRLDEKLFSFYSTVYGFNSEKTRTEIVPRITGDYR